MKLASEIPIIPKITMYNFGDTNRALIDLKTDRISRTGVIVIP